MSREWQPGDLALVTEYGDPIPAVRAPQHCGIAAHLFPDVGDHWHYLRTTDQLTTWTSKGDASARPFIVIDLEDREQVERLTKALVDAADHDGNVVVSGNGIHPDTMVRALREFADPKPPKPDEETGLGAAVRATAYTDKVRLFVRIGAEKAPWMDSDGNGHEWAELDVVEVIAPGVNP